MWSPPIQSRRAWTTGDPAPAAVSSSMSHRYRPDRPIRPSPLSATGGPKISPSADMGSPSRL